MNRKQFLNQIDTSLKKLSLTERQDILQDYEEHFAMGIKEGKTEEQIAASLGSPQQIAKELLAMYHLDKVEATASIGNMTRAVWAVIGLGFFNLVIVLGPFLGLVGIVFGGWIAGIGFTASPLLIFVKILFNLGSFELFDLFFSLVLCGLGLFIIVGMFMATKALTNWFVRYLKYNALLVKGGLKHD